jgi:uncharacterized protein
MRINRWQFGLAIVAVLGGCGVEQIAPGLFTPPAQKQVMFIPTDVGLDYEPIEIPVSSDHSLQGWLIPAADAPGTVVINHGAFFSRWVLLPQCAILHDLGYNVLVYDYQGYGDSAGVACLGSLIPDANAALAYLKNRGGPGSGRVVLFGISMGTRVTLAQAAGAPPGVVGAIFDGSFVNEGLPVWTALVFGVIPFPEIVEQVTAMYPELDPYQYIGQISLPKLFLQSPQDIITPMPGAERLFELTPEPKTFHEVFGGHLLPSVLDPNYREFLKEFLTPLMTERAPAGE